MNIHPELIVMLTHNDQTVENAREVFESCKNSKARFWGFKEEPLPIQSMKELYSIMKECGKPRFSKSLPTMKRSVLLEQIRR